MPGLVASRMHPEQSHSQSQLISRKHSQQAANSSSSDTTPYAVPFTTYLPPSPPKSRSPSPYRTPELLAGQFDGAGPRLRNSAAHGHGHHLMDHANSAGSEYGAPGPGSGAVASSTLSKSASALQNGVLAGEMGPQQRRSSSGAAHSPHYAHFAPNVHVNGGSVEAQSINGYQNGTPALDQQHNPNHVSFASNFVKSAGDYVKSASNGTGLTARGSATLPSFAPSAGHQPGTTASSTMHSRRKSVAQAITPSISTVRFVSYCTLWYASSAFSNNTGKSILNRFKYPVTLTFIQFGFVAGWCVLFCVGRAKLAQWGFNKDHHGHSRALSNPYGASGWGIKTPSKTALYGIVVMSGFQITGHIFSSMATARVPVSTVHTIKALSPLFTVLSYAVLFRVRYSSKTYLSLLPLTLGVMLACSFDFRANAVGFLCALGSTLVFVSQNIFSKKLLPKDGAHGHGAASDGEKKLDKLHLLLYSSGMAFCLMIPLWAYYDGSVLLFGNPTRTATIPALLFYYTINGSVHFLQNLLAFAILSLTSPVTYSIASLVKRIAVILMAIVWFGQTMNTVQAAGISLTFFGLWMYNQAKGDVNRGESARTRAEKRSSVLLPTTKEDLTSESDSGKARGGWGGLR